MKFIFFLLLGFHFFAHSKDNVYKTYTNLFDNKKSEKFVNICFRNPFVVNAILSELARSSNDKKVYNCNNLRIKLLFNLERLDIDLRERDVTHNIDSTKLKNADFIFLDNLKELHVNSTRIDIIFPEMLSFPNLRVLFVNGPITIFSKILKMPNLKNFTLYSTLFEYCPILLQPTNLKKFILSSEVKIDCNSLISSQKELEVVSLKNIKSDEPFNVLGGHKNLESLNFMNSNIKEIPDNLFDLFPNIKYLNLDNNQISKISSFVDFSRLESFSLNDNNLNVFPDNYSIYNIKSVNFSGNEIKSVKLPNNAISQDFDIKFLRLSKNQISEINYNNTLLKQLTVFDVSDNELELKPPTNMNIYFPNINKFVYSRFSKTVFTSHIPEFLQKPTGSTAFGIIDTSLYLKHSLVTQHLSGVYKSVLGEHDFIDYGAGDHGTLVLESFLTNISSDNLSIYYSWFGYNFDDIVAYFKTQNVRVINGSFSFKKDIPTKLIGNTYISMANTVEPFSNHMHYKKLIPTIKDNPEILFIFSAGNQGMNLNENLSAPCSFLRAEQIENLICVAGANKSGDLHIKSNYGDSVEYIAPWEFYSGIVSYPIGGTSSAAPVVSAAAVNFIVDYKKNNGFEPTVSEVLEGISHFKIQ